MAATTRVTPTGWLQQTGSTSRVTPTGFNQEVTPNNITLNMNVGNAVAAGSTATITNIASALSVSRVFPTGWLQQTGITARVAPSGFDQQSASATGTTISFGIGNAVAVGLTATIAGNVTLSMSIGNAVAAGLTASISVTTSYSFQGSFGVLATDYLGFNYLAGAPDSVAQASVYFNVGNAVAAGVAANFGPDVNIQFGVGNAVAAGLTASISQDITVNFGVGNAVAAGLTVDIQTPYILLLTATQAIHLESILRMHGIINQLVVTASSRSDGVVSQTISTDSTGAVTITTTALPAIGFPTVDMIEKVARLYGLIDPLTVTTAYRTDGTVTQNFSISSGTTTVTMQ